MFIMVRVTAQGLPPRMSVLIVPQAGLSAAPIGMMITEQASAQTATARLEMEAGVRSIVMPAASSTTIFRNNHQSPIERRTR